ncbi:MAG: hypothetical protein NTX52_08675, partial [Planctomycetota bacterium]|nr:hypothetical protein [Planctomycetota bacterium]
MLMIILFLLFYFLMVVLFLPHLHRILTEWRVVASWITAIGTLILASVAIWGEQIRRFLFGPRLDVEVGQFCADAVPVPITQDKRVLTRACYFQIRVRNNGKSAAKNVEVFVSQLQKQDSNGKFENVREFYPLNLKWRHYDTVFLERMSPSTGRDCCLGRVVYPPDKRIGGIDDYDERFQLRDDEPLFRLELAIIPNPSYAV